MHFKFQVRISTSKDDHGAGFHAAVPTLVEMMQVLLAHVANVKK